MIPVNLAPVIEKSFSLTSINTSVSIGLIGDTKKKDGVKSRKQKAQYRR